MNLYLLYAVKTRNQGLPAMSHTAVGPTWYLRHWYCHGLDCFTKQHRERINGFLEWRKFGLSRFFCKFTWLLQSSAMCVNAYSWMEEFTVTDCKRWQTEICTINRSWSTSPMALRTWLLTWGCVRHRYCTNIRITGLYCTQPSLDSNLAYLWITKTKQRQKTTQQVLLIKTAQCFRFYVDTGKIDKKIRTEFFKRDRAHLTSNH